MKFLAMLLLCYGLGLLLSFAQSPRIFLEYPQIFYEPKECEVSWRIEGQKIKNVYVEKIVSGKKPEIVAKKLPLSGKMNLAFEKDIYYDIIAETKRDVYKKRISPKFVQIALSKFECSKTSIDEGEATELYWKAAANNVVTIFAGERTVGANLLPEATLKVRPDTTKYYKIVVSAPQTDKKITDSILIEVKKPVYFNVPSAVFEQDSIEISWSMPSSHKVSLLELEKALSEEQLQEASLPKNTKHKIIKENLPLRGRISLAPLKKNQKKAIFLLIAEDKDGNKTFFQKITESIKEEIVEMSPERPSLPTIPVIVYAINGKVGKANTYYNRVFVKENEMINFQWRVENASKVSVKYFKDKPLTINNAVGSLNFSATHSIEIYIEAVGEDEKQSITSTVYFKVKSRRVFIKNNKDISQFSPKDNYRMEVIEVNRKLYPQKVTLKVIAYDSLGNFVTGLSKEPNKYFKKIYESIEGKNIEVKDFQVQEIIEEMGEPKVFGVCTDYSGSMSGEAIEMAEKALKVFLENKFDRDIIAMNKFDDKLATIVKPTNSKEKLLEEYKFVGLDGSGGGTALYAGADEALNAIEKLQTGEKYLVLLTDGYENSSFQYFETHAYTGQQLAEKARRLGIKFIVISFGEGTNEIMLRALAELTDGYFYNIDDPKDIIGAYKEIPRIFKHYYQISYTPVVKNEGGRKVVLEYFDNKKMQKLQRNIHIGEKFNIKDLDTQVGVSLRSGANRNSLFPNKQLLISPQTVANFQFNKVNLEWRYISNIDKYINFMKKNPKVVAVIYGHTDLVGEASKQITLSAQRAEVIRQKFIAGGIDASRIKVQACGKMYPLWQREDYPWQAQENRRVEIALYE
jgi:outer membrane protein OmpA-like peptidoglycan-associated protein